MAMKKSFANMSSSKAAKRRIRSSIVKTSRWSCFEGFGLWGFDTPQLAAGSLHYGGSAALLCGANRLAPTGSRGLRLGSALVRLPQFDRYSAKTPVSVLQALPIYLYRVMRMA